MVVQLRKEYRLQKKSFGIDFLILFGVYWIGVGLRGLLMALDSSDSAYFSLGTVLGLGCLAILLVVRRGIWGNLKYQVAVSMTQRRIDHLKTYLLLVVLELAAGYLLLWIFFRLETGLYHLAASNRSIPTNAFLIFQWQFVLSACLIILLATLFCSAIFGRFGNRGLFVLYLAFLAAVFVAPRLVILFTQKASPEILSIGQQIWSVVGKVPVKGWIGLGILMWLVVFWVSWKLLLRQSVRL
jgi:hypothetical protein